MQHWKLVQLAHPQQLQTTLGTYYNCPSTTPISQNSHPFYYHSFQPNTFQSHNCNLQTAQLSRNVHIASEPSHMDHQHHFQILSSHSHFVFAHLVNEYKSKNYTTQTKDLSPYQPSLLPLHSHKISEKENFKNLKFLCGSRTTAKYKRGLIFSLSSQYFSNQFAYLWLCFLRECFGI